MVALQAGFTLLLALDTIVTLQVVSEPLTWAAITPSLMALGVLVLTVLVPWTRLPSASAAVLPVLDLAALGLARIVEPGTGADILCVVPAVWLGRLGGRWGAVAAGVTAVATMTVPWLVVLGPVDGNIAGALLVPLVATGVGLMVAWSDRGVARRHDELREALASVEVHRRFNAAILDSVDVGLVLLDRDGRYQAINRRHRDFMELAFPDGHGGVAGQLGEVYDADGTTLLTREDMPTYRASRGEEFDDARIWVGGDPLTRRALSVSARSVRDADGAFTGAALAYTDVTDYVRALAVKDEFVASVSHELRTPLTSIVGYTQLLQEEDEDQGRIWSRYLDVVARNADRLNRLVADLLQSARLDQGRLKLSRSETCLAQIVRDSVRSAAATAPGAGHTLEVDVPDSLVVLADPQRMAQVVDNLVSNALKYTPPGGRVVVTLAVDGDAVELSVRDTGIGIAAVDRDRLFTRFFRAREAEELSIQGVGLGLSITKAIVEAHGGRIEVESEPGEGSTFRVRLPRALAESRG